MKKLLQDYRDLFRNRDRGTVAIAFLLSFPILLLILSFITQYALIINARLVLNHAVAAAARSALSALPTDPAVDKFADGTSLDGAVVVNRAACMELSSISPQAQGGSNSEAQQVTEALQSVGLPIPDSYADRFTFAEAATVVSWQRLDSGGQPIAETQWEASDFATAPGQQIQLTIQYNFQLTAPGAKLFIGHPDTIAGVTGRFITLTSTYTVQLSPGRETITDANGYPLTPVAH